MIEELQPSIEEGQIESAHASRPRHCMVVHAYYPLDPRVQREAEALVEAGFAVDVICLRDEGEQPEERYHGVDIHRLPVRIDKTSLSRQLLSYLRFLARATFRLASLQRRLGYGTVQVHNLPDFLVFCALVPKLDRVPVILDLHDLMPEFFAGRFGPGRRPWLARLIRWQERLSCRFADHVITVSQHWRRALIRRGIPADKCTVIMNAADQRVFRPRKRANKTEDEFRLVYHGSVTHRYGLDLALHALDMVRRDVPEVRLTIFGRGDGMPEVEELIERLGLADLVRVREDVVPREDLPDIIASGDVGIVPYRNDVFTDGIVPTKLMEYAAMEIPCIAARTTAIDSYFRDAMVEFFEPGDIEGLADRIRQLRADPERRAQLARASVSFTRRYSWEQVGPEYVALVRRLSERRRARLRSPSPYMRPRR